MKVSVLWWLMKTHFTHCLWTDGHGPHFLDFLPLPFPLPDWDGCCCPALLLRVTGPGKESVMPLQAMMTPCCGVMVTSGASAMVWPGSSTHSTSCWRSSSLQTSRNLLTSSRVGILASRETSPGVGGEEVTGDGEWSLSTADGGEALDVDGWASGGADSATVSCEVGDRRCLAGEGDLL